MLKSLIVLIIFSFSISYNLQAMDFYEGLQGDSGNNKEAQSSIIYYPMPKVGRQNDGWSCGINSGTKFLRYHGMATDYSELKAIRKREMTSTGIKIPKFLQVLDNANPVGLALNNIHRLGTPPRVLRSLINWQFIRFKSKKRVDIYWDQTITDLRKHLKTGPVIILIEPREPYLHWIVVNGYDSSKNTFRISETSDKDYHYTESLLKKKWLKWDGMLDWLPGVGLKEGVIITLR
tara:strand:+ start:1870 stop:2571 length:702 start_codon:yes stop_codon:yes gene_type:complete